MKKLLVLFLVLSMASLADAAVLELSVGGERDGAGNTTEITIFTGSAITVDVYSNTVAPAPDTWWLGIVADTGDDWNSGTKNCLGNAEGIESLQTLKAATAASEH